MITSGANEKTGGATDRSEPSGRLRLLDMNAGVYGDILPQLHKAAPDAVILVVTDPPDPLADLARVFGIQHVLSMGTYLDSLRFRFHLARQLHVAPASVEANVLGEHGTSEVFVWSSARAGEISVLDLLARTGSGLAEIQQAVERDVRYANITVIEGTGASQYGVGMVCARITDMVLRDERAVIPMGSYNPAYGVTLSVPSVVGRSGVVQIFEPDLSEDERRALQRSADTLQQAMGRMQGSRSARAG
jgi:L-lactate dehydrogenase